MDGDPDTVASFDIAPVLERLTAFVDARLAHWHTPGVVIALTDRERVLGVVARGFADLAARRPVSSADRFQIGSVSKSFAAVMVLQERERGTLDLHTPITDYVPWFRVRSRFAPITLHHLLTHTSGLPEGTDASMEARHELWLLKDFECRYAPGERFLYSNDGYKLIGIALEEVTGRPYPALLAERLLVPLGMTESSPQITLADRAVCAKPHWRLFDDRRMHAGQPLVEAPWYETASADGSIIAPAGDLCAYARFLLGKGAGGDERLLSVESYALLTAALIEEPDEEGRPWYGYGLETLEDDGRALVGHSGGMVGFSSYLLLDEEAGLGVVVLMNGNETRQDLARYALRAGRAAAEARSLPEPPPPADSAFLGEDAQMYVGVYGMPGDPSAESPPGDEPMRAPSSRSEPARVQADEDVGEADGQTAGNGDDLPLGGSLELAASDGRLVLRHPTAGDVVLERVDRDVFVVPHPDLDRFVLRFWRDDDGRVSYATHGGAWYAGPGYAGPASFAPVPGGGALCGHYLAWSAWMGHLRVVERRGSLWLVAPWVEAEGDELELVPLGDGSFRVGTEDWRPNVLTIDTVLDGRATRAIYDILPFHRASTP